MSKLFKKQKTKMEDNSRQNQDPQKPEDLLLLRDYQENIDRIQKEMGNSSDIVIRKFTFMRIKGALVYIEGMADSKVISDFILESIINENSNEEDIIDPFKAFFDKAVVLGNIQILKNWDELYEALLVGDTVVFLNGYKQAVRGSTVGGEKRSITESTTEVAIRGAKDAFTESLRTNTSLIRRRIKSPNLWLESMKIGQVTQTEVAIMYIKGIANEKIIGEVRERLSRIDIDGVLDSGYIEQSIEDQTWSTFPTIFHSERPDVIVSQLLEGKIAILVDGTPFVLSVPALFIQFFQSPDDYYSRFDISTGIRFLRLLAFLTALIGPATYIAATTFHQEMIPTTMAIAIAAQRENVPFPAFVEAMIMEVTFEILREAGIRLPRAVGQAVSIVGALVIGQAAVQAGFVSPVMVIVVSMTAIANFSTPSFSMAISLRLLRFVIMGFATVLGFYGIMLCIIFMMVHLCSLRSFGVPYMSPMAPISINNQRDVLIRFPIWALKNRPSLISQKNVSRTGENQKPEPPKKTSSDTKKGE